MSISKETIQQRLAYIESRDTELAAELETVRKERAATAGTKISMAAPDTEGPQGLDLSAYDYGTIVRPVTTVPRPPVAELAVAADPHLAMAGPPPAINVKNGRLRSGPGTPEEGETWQKRLEDAGAHLFRAIDAVGRIGVKGNGDLTVAGTGFLVRRNVIATNQHVAEQFAEAGDEGGFLFRLNLGDEEMKPSIDFLEELGNDRKLEFRILGVLAMDAGRDVAFLEVELVGTGGRYLPEPLELFTGDLEAVEFVAAIGYPQRDTREKHAAELEAIFHDVFDKKRVSPGQIRRIEDGAVVHDCSVLRGNSGSPLVDLKTGQVVGMHRMGEFLEENVAVPAATVAEILARVPDVPDRGSPPDVAKAA